MVRREAEEVLDVLPFREELEDLEEFDENVLYKQHFASQNALCEELRMVNWQGPVKPAYYVKQLESSMLA